MIPDPGTPTLAAFLAGAAVNVRRGQRQATIPGEAFGAIAAGRLAATELAGRAKPGGDVAGGTAVAVGADLRRSLGWICSRPNPARAGERLHAFADVVVGIEAVDKEGGATNLRLRGHRLSEGAEARSLAHSATGEAGYADGERSVTIVGGPAGLEAVTAILTCVATWASPGDACREATRRAIGSVEVAALIPGTRHAHAWIEPRTRMGRSGRTFRLGALDFPRATRPLLEHVLAAWAPMRDDREPSSKAGWAEAVEVEAMTDPGSAVLRAAEGPRRAALVARAGAALVASRAPAEAMAAFAAVVAAE